MKRMIIGASIFLGGITLLVYGQTHFETTSKREVSLLGDITDTTISHPDTTEICSLFDLGHDKWQSIAFRAQAITNYENNRVYTADLQSRVALFANPDERDQEVNGFKRKCISAISAIDNAQFGRPKSSIYMPLVTEMNRLARSTAGEKTCVLYSDCRENALFSVYRYEDSLLLSTHPDQVIQKLTRICKPLNMHGVTLYIVHASLSEKDNTEFIQMAGVFKQLFEQYGAKVVIGSNLVPE